jgi:hypothetical protein
LEGLLLQNAAAAPVLAAAGAMKGQHGLRLVTVLVVVVARLRYFLVTG